MLPTEETGLIDIKAPPVENEEQIDLYGETPPTTVDDEVAGDRALKAVIGLGENPEYGVTEESLKSSILTGTERYSREQASLRQDIELRRVKGEMINEMLAEAGPDGIPQETIEFILGATEEHLANPDTIFETEYAKKYFGAALLLSEEENAFREAADADPKNAFELVEGYTGMMIRKEVAQTMYENLQAQWEEMSFGGKLGDTLETFIPFKTWANQSDAIQGSDGSFSLDANKQEQFDQLLSLPVEQFPAALKAAVDSIAESNISDAMKFLDGIMGYSTSDKAWDKLQMGFDFADVATLGVVSKLAKGGARAAGAVGRLATREAKLAKLNSALQNVLKSSRSRSAGLEDAAAAVGDIPMSATISILKRWHGKVRGLTRHRRGDSLFQEVPSMLNPRNWMAGPARLAREYRQRITENLETNATKMLQSMTDLGKATRLSDEALLQAIEGGKNIVKRRYTHIQDALIDIKPTDDYDPFTNTITLNATFGKPDGTLFDNISEALHFGVNEYRFSNAKGAWTLEEIGDKYAINVPNDIDETRSDVRGALTIGTHNSTPKSFANLLVGVLRTPEDTLSFLNRENRHAATHGMQEMLSLVSSISKGIGKLTNSQADNLEAVLKANRDFIGPEPMADGTFRNRRGMFHESIGELENSWYAINKVYPTEKEIEAYFTYVQMMDMDYVYRNLGLFRDKVRQGIERFRYKMGITNQQTGQPQRIDTPWFEGRLTDNNELPWNHSQDAGIMVYDSDTRMPQYFRKNQITKEGREYIDLLTTEKGYRVIQTANPTKNSHLEKITGVSDVVNFMVIKDFEFAPLEWKQFSRRPGGHLIYADHYFAKQPILRQTSYGKLAHEGDESIMTFTSEAEAKKMTPLIDQARQLLKAELEAVDDIAKATDEADNFIRKNLPWSVQEFRSFFIHGMDDAGNSIPPKFSLDHEFNFVRDREGIDDKMKDILLAKYPNIEFLIDSPFNLYKNIDKKFAGERDENLPTFTEGPNGYELGEPRLVEPLQALNKSASNIIRSRFLSDYIFSSVESFIQEFGHLMDIQGGIAALRENPVRHLHNPQWKNNVDATELRAAKNARLAIRHFIGTPTAEAEVVEGLKQKLLSAIYNKAGQKATDWVADRMLGTVVDPFSYARSIAFHAKLGLFNTVQMFLQAQTLTHIMAISPRYALQSMSAGFLMRLVKGSHDDIPPHFAKMAAKIGGWTEDEFMESFNELKKTGLWNVEGEVAWKDTFETPALYSRKGKQAVGKVLNAGTWFFKEGERMVRLTAWNAAFKEWRAANPYAKITNAERNKIIRRANDLGVNMTRASNASWQKGLLSIPTQFWGYQTRLMEQMLGKRLTPQEKTRAFLVYSAIYGVPTATGVAAGVPGAVLGGIQGALVEGDPVGGAVKGALGGAWPFKDTIRQAALEQGMNVDNPMFETYLDGIPSMIMEYFTNTDMDWSGRLGPQGLSILKDIANGDAIMSEILMGASGNILGDILSSSEPIVKSIYKTFTGKGDGYPLHVQDIIDATREISTVNNFAKMWYAINYENYVTRNEVHIEDDVNTREALFMGIFGVTPQEINDTFLMIESNQQIQDAQNEAKKHAIKYFRRSLAADDPGEMEEYRIKARAHLIAGGFRADQMSSILNEALSGQIDLVSKIRHDFYFTKAPLDQGNQRLEEYLRQGREE